MYGLSQGGHIANVLVKKRLHPHRYYKCEHTLSLARHITNPVCFMLWVDKFSIKYVNKRYMEHMVSVLKKHYKMSIDFRAQNTADSLSNGTG